jgi:ketosteroid isomerase-like protein
MLLTRAVRLGFSAIEREDYEEVTALPSPDIEMYLLPDAPEERPGDTQAVYVGAAEWARSPSLWTTDFDDVRWEPREIFDPGGDRLAARVERIGRGTRSGVEVRDQEFHVAQFERGRLRRHWIVRTKEAMLALLQSHDLAGAGQSSDSSRPASCEPKP